MSHKFVLTKIIKKSQICSFILFFMLYSIASGSPGFIEGMLFFGENNFIEARAVFEKVIEDNPEDAYAYYYLGVTSYRLEDYSKAVESFLEAGRINPEIKEIPLFLGKAYYGLGMYPRALEELKKAELLLPTSGRTLFYQGLVYYENGEYFKSAGLFSRAAELDYNLRLNALEWEGASLRAARHYISAEKKLREARRIRAGSLTDAEYQVDKKPATTFNTTFFLGAEYDDNVVLAPDERLPQINISKQSDLRTILGLNFRGTFDREMGQLRAGYSFYQSLHRDLQEYDLQGHNADISYSYNKNAMRPSLAYQISYYSAGGEDYLLSQSLTPSIYLLKQQDSYIRAHIQLEKKDFLQQALVAENNRDSLAYNGGLNSSFPIFKNAALKTGFQLGYNNAEGDNWEHFAYSCLGEIEVPFYPYSEEVVLNLKAVYDGIKFENTDSIFGVKRDDGKISLSAGLMWFIRQNISFSLTHIYIRNNSSIDAYEYRRNITSLLFGIGI